MKLSQILAKLDKETASKVNTVVVALAKINPTSTSDKHQLKIALDTVKNPNKAFLGGLSVEDAKDILKKKFKYSDAEIKKLEASIVAQKEEIEEPEEDARPENDDAFLAPSGPLGSMTSLTVDRKFIGEFKSDDAAEIALVSWINKNKVWPSVWYVSDHGNVEPYQLEEKNRKNIKM